MRRDSAANSLICLWILPEGAPFFDVFIMTVNHDFAAQMFQHRYDEVKRKISISDAIVANLTAEEIREYQAFMEKHKGSE